MSTNKRKHVTEARTAKRAGKSSETLLTVLLYAVLLSAFISVPVFAMGTCSGPSEPQSASPESASAPEESTSVSDESASAEVVEEYFGEPDLETLYNLLAEEDVESILAQAVTNPDAAWIAANASAYDDYDLYVELKVLRLVASEPLSAGFVRRFPDSYPTDPDWVEDDEPDYSAPALPAGSPSPDVPDTAIPHLYQWDERWGFTTYNGEPFGIAGCGPTAVAMVYQGLTGNTDISPYDIGKWAIDNGYAAPYVGTSNELCYDAADYLGLQCEEIPISAESIIATLEEGKPIIANVAPGTFTDFGHYFVLTSVTSDGQVILNDPFSGTRSSQLWDPELIASESFVLYAYSL